MVSWSEELKKTDIVYMTHVNQILFLSVDKEKRLTKLIQHKAKKNPLHGKTLESILIELVDKVGWIEMNKRVEINCFYTHPSIKSNLKFLRKETWARIRVEKMYLDLIINSNEINNGYH